MAKYKSKVPSELETNVNYLAFKDQQEAGKLAQYAGQRVAFADGKFVVADKEVGTLLDKLEQLCPNQEAFIQYITLPGEKERVYHIHSPLRVRE